jgi:hypothetical protein
MTKKENIILPIIVGLVVIVALYFALKNSLDFSFNTLKTILFVFLIILFALQFNKIFRILFKNYKKKVKEYGLEGIYDYNSRPLGYFWRYYQRKSAILAFNMYFTGKLSMDSRLKKEIWLFRILGILVFGSLIWIFI